jgi:hypothetical protein
VAGWLSAILVKCSLRGTVGVYVADQEVTVSRVALTLLGPVELSSRTEPYEPEELAEVLETVLAPPAGRKRGFRSPVCVGLPPLRVFFSTRSLRVKDRDTAPNMMLHEVLQSSNVNVDDMEVDLIRAQPGNRPMALIVAARRKYLSGVLTALERCKVRPLRVEPAPFALLRLAVSRHRSPRKAKAVIRVFLGATQAVAVLVARDTPLSWRVFELPAGNEATAICSTVRAIQIVARFRGDVGAPGALLFHGRPDLSEALTPKAFQESLEVHAQHFPEPGYDNASIALGLALGSQQGDEAFDLSRALKPKAPFWEIFPFGDVALQAALLLCVTLFLHSTYESARRAYAKVRVESDKHRWVAKVDDEKLEKEKKELEQKIEAIQAYLNSRILWTAYTRDASSRLPETIVLKSFDGLCELDMGKGRVKGKKSLVMKLATPIPKGQSMPREIDVYLGDLRGDPLLKRDFPVVALADLKWNQAGTTGTALAEFTVTCLPSVDKKAPASGDAAKTKPTEH